MDQRQKQLNDRAEEEEKQRKLKEAGALNILNKFTGEYEKLQKEMAQPNKNQKKERFHSKDKFALIYANEKYDRTIMTDLPEVKDDHSSIKETVEMMNIPETNIYELEDASYE